MNRDWQRIAEDLLDFTTEKTLWRTRRIAAIYASLYQENPLYHEWCALGALQAASAAGCLQVGAGFYQDLLERQSLARFRVMVPAFLAFRAGGDTPAVFEGLKEAKALPKAEGEARRALSYQATVALIRHAEAEAVQPLLGALPEVLLKAYPPYQALTMPGREGYPEILQYEGEAYHQLEARAAWLTGPALEGWRWAVREAGAKVVAQVRDIQRLGWFRPSDLP